MLWLEPPLFCVITSCSLARNSNISAGSGSLGLSAEVAAGSGGSSGSGGDELITKTDLSIWRRSAAKLVCSWSATPAMHTNRRCSRFSVVLNFILPAALMAIATSCAASASPALLLLLPLPLVPQCSPPAIGDVSQLLLCPSSVVAEDDPGAATATNVPADPAALDRCFAWWCFRW